MQNSKSVLLFPFIAMVFLAQSQNFTKVTNNPIATTAGDSRSVNWIDVNNDGWLDCMISNGPKGGQHNSLFINDKQGSFTLLTNDPIVQDNTPSDGATWGDSDNDGDIDCFVVNWYAVNNLFFQNNGNGSFQQNKTEILAKDGGYSETAAWGDYDKDGLLDLYVTNSDGDFRNFLYRNLGNNKFSKITNIAPVTDASASRSVNWVDIDNDNDLDLFVTNENGQNEQIYRNDTKGVFTKITNSNLVKDGKNTISSSWADYDNDGDLDVFLCNDNATNSLFRNDGNFVFNKIVNDTIAKNNANAFSSAWSDVDNDGDLDIFITHSFTNSSGLKNWFYLNNGDGSFTRKDNILTQDLAWSYGCAFGDYDNDGFEDLAVATCRLNNIDSPDLLYHNEGNTNHWLTLKLVGTESNKSAIGTKVRLKATIQGKTFWQMRELSSQSSYCGQNDLRAHFGLGDAAKADSLIIEWSLGKKQIFTNISSDNFLQIIEGQQLTLKSNDIASAKKEFDIFPNPSNGKFTLRAQMPFSIKDSINILNTHGKVLFQKIVNETSEQIEIDLTNQHLSTGIYIISVRNDKGQKTTTFIIK